MRFIIEEEFKSSYKHLLDRLCTLRNNILCISCTYFIGKNYFLRKVDFDLSRDCPIHRTTSNHKIWSTDNITNQQLNYYCDLIQNGQGFFVTEMKKEARALPQTARL